MGKKALEAKRSTTRTLRAEALTPDERHDLRQRARYEGNPQHKRNPGDFGLTPPAAPRPDKTLCDEAGVLRRAEAEALLLTAIERGLASAADAAPGTPKQLWVVDARGRVFEAMHGGSQVGCYHGYPIRQSDPLFARIVRAWSEG